MNTHGNGTQVGLDGGASRRCAAPSVVDTRRLVVPLAVAVAATATVVLVGWLGGIEFLVTFGSTVATMKVQTAAALLALSLGVLGDHWRTDRSASRTGGAVAATLGLVALTEYALDLGAGFDQLLVDDPAGVSAPGRMSVPTAVSLTLLGMGLVLFSARWARGLRLAPWVVGASLVPAGLTFLGLIFDGPALYGLWFDLTGVAGPTAAGLVGLAVAVLLDHPELPVVRLLVARDPGGSVFRRVLLVGSLVPLLSGVGYARLEQAVGWRSGTTLGLVCATTLVVLAAVAWATGSRVAREAATAAAARDQAREASNAKTEFLSRMSHELRTPMNAILGFGQLLQMRVSADEHEEADHIVRAGRHLLSLIDEVLDIARIEEGRMTASLEPVHLSVVLDEAVHVAHPADGDGEVRAEGVAQDVWVVADRQRLLQVLVNLLSNATKYNRPGGTVTLSSRTDEAGVHVSVSDEGPGVAEDALDRLFQPFERLGAETSDVPGTGLGLALSRGLARVMGGDITVTSAAGEGATFTVHLAQAAAVTSKDRAVEPRPEACAAEDVPRLILQIEDNPSNVALMERALPRLLPGTRVMSAMQGRIGVELAAKHRPDVVLLDVHLPDLNGDEVLLELRGDPATSGIPVVIVTADATSATRDRLGKAGADDLLTKPLDMPRLLAVIEQLAPVARV